MNILEILEENGFGEVQLTDRLREDLGMDSLDMARFGNEFDIADKDWKYLLTVGDLQLWVDSRA